MIVAFIELGRDVVSFDRNKAIFIRKLLDLGKARSKHHESPIAVLLNLDILLVLTSIKGKAHSLALISRLIDEVDLSFLDVVDVLAMAGPVKGEGSESDELAVQVPEDDLGGVVGEEGGFGLEHGSDGVVAAAARRTALHDKRQSLLLTCEGWQDVLRSIDRHLGDFDKVMSDVGEQLPANNPNSVCTEFTVLDVFLEDELALEGLRQSVLCREVLKRSRISNSNAFLGLVEQVGIEFDPLLVVHSFFLAQIVQIPALPEEQLRHFGHFDFV